jgi:hypothetical protein
MLGSNDEVRRCLRDLFAIEFDDSVDLSRLDNSPKS